MTDLRSVAIIWDQIATVQASAAETGATEAAAVQSVEAVIGEVAAAARNIGARVEYVPLSYDPMEMLRRVSSLRADVVVNLAESWAGRVRYEPAIAWMLELLRVPYTGASPRALALCLEKPLTRAILASSAVPVPEGWVVASDDARFDPRAFDGDASWIVKPAAQDASHGIDAASVVGTEHTMRDRVGYLLRRGLGRVLIERYVDGREFNVSIIEMNGLAARVLPIAEIDFTEFPNGIPKILTFAAKWDEASDEYRGSKSVLACGLGEDLSREIERIALSAWHALELRDYARVDLRVDRQGRPFVIDVNPNPDLSRGAGLSLAAERAGISYEEMVLGILRNAALRTPSA
jgi:D-alanine-D-alanine ligase